MTSQFHLIEQFNINYIRIDDDYSKIDLFIQPEEYVFPFGLLKEIPEYQWKESTKKEYKMELYPLNRLRCKIYDMI
jgi:hypothetical protein